MGALKINEIAGSPSYRIGSPGQPFTRTDTYVVIWVPEDVEDVQAMPDDGTLMIEASTVGAGGLKIPKVQQRYIGCDPNLSFLVCESVDWKKNPAALATWTVTANWTSHIEFIYDAEEEPEPWTRVTRTGAMRQMQIWRRETEIPDESDPVDGKTPYVFPPTAAGDDIGGDRVDIQGQPANRFVQQMQIIVEFHYDRTFTLGPDEEIQAEPGPYFSGWLGTRNSEEFLGYAPGQILCNGINVSPVNDQTYIMQFKFLFDWLSFFEQRTAPNTGGAAFIAAASTSFLGVPYNQCTKVCWYQPYPDMEDLKLMFPAAVYDAILTAKPPVNTCLTPARDLSVRQFDFPAS